MPTVHALADAIREPGLVFEDARLTGLSGKRVIAMLQRFARLADGCYLEIGVFQGLTLLSVAGAVRERVFGIDNFSQFDPDHKNLGIIEDRRTALGLANVELVNADYEDAMERIENHLGGRKIGVYFVDGPHDYRSQLMCLLLALPHLSPRAVIVVDDANYRHVRLATRDFLATHSDFALLFEAYTPCHPVNMTPTDKANAVAGWWNGIHVIVRDPERVLARTPPHTLRARTLYENEHAVHSDRYAALAPHAVRLVGEALSLSPRRFASRLRRVVRAAREIPRELLGRFAISNTFSDELPAERFNEKV